jgi:hypothetical protein
VASENSSYSAAIVSSSPTVKIEANCSEARFLSPDAAEGPGKLESPAGKYMTIAWSQFSTKISRICALFYIFG